MSTITNFFTRNPKVVQDPPFVHTLFADPRASWLWLVLRVWLGFQWLDASLHKIDNPAWTQTGLAVKGFWENAVVIPAEGRPPIRFDWYRSFLQTLLDAEAYTWMAPLIAYGELLVGIALILGAFTGIAAFFGGLMNWNFMMAGTVSSNPVLLIIAIGLIMAWKVAGYIGADYFLLRWVSTLWQSRADQEKPSSQPQLPNNSVA